MTEDKREGILRKVRGLLAKANSTPFEAEADLFRAKADDLMTAYAIEEWQIAQSAPSTERAKPVRKDMDIAWYYGDEVGEQLYSMFLAVPDHCRCAIANKNVMRVASEIVVPVFGTESDLTYANMLFTDLYIQFSSKLKPVYDPAKSDGENIYIAKEVGMPWKDIAIWIGHPEFIKYRSDGSIGSISGYLKKEYRAWAALTGVEFHEANPKSYIRNFAIGFSVGVRNKLREMREGQTSGDDSKALVLRDIVQEAREEMFGEFPNQARNSKSVSRRKDHRKIDHTAIANGATAGKEARIAGKGNKVVSNPRQLNN